MANSPADEQGESVATGELARVVLGGGMAMEPYLYSEGKPAERLESEGFRVRLVGADDPEQGVHDFAAGKSFIPPAGRWRVWLEGPGWMTPFTDLVVTRGSKPKTARTKVRPVPVIRAGSVALPTGETRAFLEPSDQVRLLYAERDPVAGAIRMELTRRVRVEDWPEQGVQMPEGRVVSALWRPRSRRYLAISSPFEVVAGETTVPSYRDPRPGTGHLTAYLELPPGTKGRHLLDVGLQAKSDDTEAASPDVVVPTQWGAYVFWYDLPEGDLTISGRGGRLSLPPTQVRIQDQEVERVSGHFQTLDGPPPEPPGP